jgi:hypothetical protein
VYRTYIRHIWAIYWRRTTTRINRMKLHASVGQQGLQGARKRCDKVCFLCSRYMFIILTEFLVLDTYSSYLLTTDNDVHDSTSTRWNSMHQWDSREQGKGSIRYIFLFSFHVYYTNEVFRSILQTTDKKVYWQDDSIDRGVCWVCFILNSCVLY